MSVEFSAWKQEYTLLLKGQMTHRATLGTDPRGNLTRIDNALAQMPQRLEAAKAQLDNLYQQQAGVAVLLTYSPQNGVILLVMAFLISPMGLPLAAIWLMGKVQSLKFAIQELVYG